MRHSHIINILCNNREHRNGLYIPVQHRHRCIQICQMRMPFELIAAGCLGRFHLHHFCFSCYYVTIIIGVSCIRIVVVSGLPVRPMMGADWRTATNSHQFTFVLIARFIYEIRSVRTVSVCRRIDKSILCMSM